MVCFVPGCKSGNNGSKAHLFLFPRKADEQLREVWLSNIPKRKDSKWNFKTSRLCHLHFEDQFIVKYSTVTMNGKVVHSMPRKHWTLTEDAIPTQFSRCNLPKYFDKITRRRKIPFPRQNTQATNTEDDSGESEERIFSFQMLVKEKEKIALPTDNWIVRVLNQESQIKLTQLNEVESENLLLINKQIVIDENLQPRVIAFGVDVTAQFNNAITSVEDVNQLLNTIHLAQHCPGISNYESIRECKTGLKRQQTWYSSKCEVISDKLCIHCQKFKKYLTVVFNREKNKLDKIKRKQSTPSSPSKINSYVKSLKKKINSKQSNLKRTQRKLASVKLGFKLLKKQFNELSETKLIDVINNEINIPHNMKLGMITAAKIAKAKSSTGRRYEADWLLQCILLKVKSPKAYKHLRENKMLPLPHPATLQRLIGAIPCQFGFSDFLFTEMGCQNKGKNKQDKQVVVSFDEMKVKEACDFDKINMQFQGYIDYGEFTEEYLQKSKKENLFADHALVFMARSLNSKWVQPIGAFASRDAAPGFILAKMLISCIVKLENVGFEVLSVVCDGATSNKSLWNILGIKGDYGNVKNKIQHPCDEDRFLYFLCDVPHIFKCIRNNFKTHGTKKFKGKDIHWVVYETVYNEDKLNSLRAVPKITKAHINPNNFQKMRVYLATQIFSRTMADGIQFYREHKCLKNLSGSEATEEFTRKMNDLFDALNVTLPKHGLKLESEYYQTILQFLNLLNENEDYNDFASPQTMGSLRVTLSSTKEIIVYLVNTVGYIYVLTSKLNQDCLEKFFGIVRSINGDDHHPTVISFLHLFRLLCIYVPTTQHLKGNVRTTEEYSYTLVDYLDVLRKGKKQNAITSLGKRKKYEDEILKKIVEDFEINDTISLDHSYAKTDSTNCVAFHLAGYVAFKASNFTKCVKCINSLTVSDYPFSNDCFFSKMKNLGGLKVPSKSLSDFIIKVLEPAVRSNLEIKALLGDVVKDIIASIDAIPGNSLGCDIPSHSVDLVVQIVTYYITIRMFFYCRNISRVPFIEYRM